MLKFHAAYFTPYYMAMLHFFFYIIYALEAIFI